MKDAEEGTDNALLMMDLSAAFDTVPHSILLSKLRLYGVGEKSMKWFESYIKGRCQFVEVGGKMSGVELVTLGCFQGSIGAPLLFILYVNDLVTLQDHTTKISLYADDNNYAIKLTNDEERNKVVIESKMKQIQEYMDSNRLKLNADKTKLMIMTTKQKDVHKDLKVYLKETEIEKVTFAKFLGIIISGNLKWNEYILQSENSLLKYCNRRLAALKLLSRECSINQRKILAHGLVISKITYCISCWASCPGYLKKRLQDIMNETVRIVHGSRIKSLKEQFRDLDWLTLEGWMNYMDILTGKTISANHRT